MSKIENEKNLLEDDNCEDKLNNEDQKNYENTTEELEEEIDIEALTKQLDIINVSLDTIYVIFLAIFLNIQYLTDKRKRLLDQINNTNYAKNDPDLSKMPKFTNLMIIYGTGIFLMINLSSYLEVADLPEGQVTEKEKRKAWKVFISSLLVYLAACISKSNIEV